MQTYDQSGNYVVIAGLVVSVASHFGFTVTTNDVLTVIGAIAILYGAIRQFIAHKKLAIATGSYSAQK